MRLIGWLWVVSVSIVVFAEREAISVCVQGLIPGRLVPWFASEAFSFHTNYKGEDATHSPIKHVVGYLLVKHLDLDLSTYLNSINIEPEPVQ